MSNRARRRAPTKRHGTGSRPIPVCPGVIPVDTPEWRQRALQEAHAVLPVVPHTRVVVRLWERERGLQVIRAAFGQVGVDLITELLDDRGPQAMVTMGMRVDADFPMGCGS